jgi:hypothetical protein
MTQYYLSFAVLHLTVGRSYHFILPVFLFIPKLNPQTFFSSILFSILELCLIAYENLILPWRKWSFTDLCFKYLTFIDYQTVRKKGWKTFLKMINLSQVDLNFQIFHLLFFELNCTFRAADFMNAVGKIQKSAICKLLRRTIFIKANCWFC